MAQSDYKRVTKTIVLDDDPTGTQSASDVTVLFDTSVELIADALKDADSVYVLTNSRALDRDSAIRLLERVRDDALGAGRELGCTIDFVLRGDSTLRGHVFDEASVFLDDRSSILFVPAFPDGGRVTLGGVHYVRQEGRSVPAHLTEFAHDPVFPFSTSLLVGYVAEKSGRPARSVSLSEVRDGHSLSRLLVRGEPGGVIVPDAETNDDILLIARAVRAAKAQGARIVIRSASPLAAELAGVTSKGLLPTPLLESPRPTLLVCGSHTRGATTQLECLRDSWGVPVEIRADEAMEDPISAGLRAAGRVAVQLADRGLALVATERIRSEAHNTLDHGSLVMAALTTVVRTVADSVDVIVSKGGITSADVARVGVGASSAHVLGQVLPGISVWSLVSEHGRPILYVVVPGNVGEPDALLAVLTTLGYSSER